MKREITEQVKKLRSGLRRRRRLIISPVLYADGRQCSIAPPMDFCDSSHLTREVSCDSSRASVNKPRSKRGFEQICGFGQREEFRRVTRSYYRQRMKERKEKEEEEEEKKKKRLVEGCDVEISESSCVESCSNQRSSLSKRNTDGNAPKFGGEVEGSEAISNSNVSCVQTLPGKFSRKIFKSGREKARDEENLLEINLKNVVHRVEQPRNSTEEPSFAILNSESTLEQKPELFADGSNLACSEHLCLEDLSDYSSTFSDLQSEIFYGSSESIMSDSGSEFSERSADNTTPTPTFASFLHFRTQFYDSAVTLDPKFSSHFEDEHSVGLTFEDEEHERSYQMLRERERRRVYLHDYAEEYCSTTEYGELVIQQRLQMVHWIVEQSTTKELQKETMFLGVNLLDRFLSRGFFKNKRNLQILGVACLVLATRIEENQHFNSVRQKTFTVESNVYKRSEVVAMEWLVQEVLSYQCFLPTIYNFLWFYLKAADANEEVERRAKYLAVLVLLGHEQLCYWPSTVAAGLVILASLAAHQDASCNRVIKVWVQLRILGLRSVKKKKKIKKSGSASASMRLLESHPVK
ncbi:cyclin-SDS isoform X2 [Diospyros lotus]|uniref:cyclin-SDS isoform X2 n=1 Tax=Diospyros lotus TaxID=55363 RepID=UPI00224EF064|nr:cyclin-SDS isoform X2 [Diospyros lotus]